VIRRADGDRLMKTVHGTACNRPGPDMLAARQVLIPELSEGLLRQGTRSIH
jgi:hypothetical protein